MKKIQLRNGTCIGEKERPYIIAELNSSHNGNMDDAKAMVLAAKECGCDCVKFQSWTTDTLYSDEYYEANPISKRIVSKFSLDENQMSELAKYCEEIGIDFSSTPYSNAEVDFLVDKTQAPFIKVSSMEINNIPFLKYIAAKQIPIILSTGMANIEEINEAVNAIESVGNNKIIILHCVSLYPAGPSIINLNNIKMLQDNFPHYSIGYSDHTIGIEVAAASVALGAVCVEKHFTLDNKKMGMDNNMATEPKEMHELVIACHNVYSSLGSYERCVSEDEKIQCSKMRRSIVTRYNMTCGDIISYENVDFKRPGDGLAPNFMDKIVGNKLNKDIPKGYKILEIDIQ